MHKCRFQTIRRGMVDWIVFYAVSAIFLLYNGGRSRHGVPYSKPKLSWIMKLEKEVNQNTCMKLNNKLDFVSVWVNSHVSNVVCFNLPKIYHFINHTCISNVDTRYIIYIQFPLEYRMNLIQPLYDSSCKIISRRKYII